MTKNPYAYVAWSVQNARQWEASSARFLAEAEESANNSSRATRVVELAVADYLAAKMGWLSAIRCLLEE